MLPSKPEHFRVKERAMNDDLRMTGMSWGRKPGYAVAFAFRLETNNKGSLIHRETSPPYRYNKRKGGITQGSVILKHYKNCPKEKLKETDTTSRQGSWYLS